MAVIWLLFSIWLVLSPCDADVAKETVKRLNKDCKSLEQWTTNVYSNRCGTIIATLLQHYTGILSDASLTSISSSIIKNAQVEAASANCSIGVEQISADLASITNAVLHSPDNLKSIQKATDVLLCLEHNIISKFCKHQSIVCKLFHIYFKAIQSVKNKHEKNFQLSKVSQSTEAFSARQPKHFYFESTCFLRYVVDNQFLTAASNDLIAGTIYNKTIFSPSQEQQQQWRLIPVEGTQGMFKLQSISLNEYLSVLFPIGVYLPDMTFCVTTNAYSECDYHFLWRIEETSGGTFFLAHNSTNMYLSVYKDELGRNVPIMTELSGSLFEFLCSG